MKNNAKILIIEDDFDILEVMTLAIKNAGYQVDSAMDVETGWERIKSLQPDLVLMDVNLPDGNGFDIGRKFHEISDGVLIFVTANNDIEQKLEGFEIGADDYITKPFVLKEVLARIQVHLKHRTSKNVEKAIQFGDLNVVLDGKTVYKNGELLHLFAKEKKLLFYLIENVDKVLNIEQLINHVWGYDGVADTKTVSVHISTLRRKIEDNPSKPQFIKTMRGFGYMFSSKNHKAPH
ncbi:response regulator transcription factor [Viridibacillus arvi]|uniref:response regulator transcription factor n=1 Tax=Viridibacillus arvi TaxID=263475 RepID=UPI003CFD0F96